MIYVVIVHRASGSSVYFGPFYSIERASEFCLEIGRGQIVKLESPHQLGVWSR